MLCTLLPSLSLHISHVCASSDGIAHLAGLLVEFTSGPLRLICLLLHEAILEVLPSSIREGWLIDGVVSAFHTSSGSWKTTVFCHLAKKITGALI